MSIKQICNLFESKANRDQDQKDIAALKELKRQQS